MIKLKTIEDVGNLQGKRVLLRLDFNAPVEDGKVKDSYRLDKAINTIDLFRHKKAKVIIISHTESKENNSLLSSWDYLNGFLPIKFSPTFFTKESDEMVSNLKDGEVLLFENIRINKEEKENDLVFAEKLSKYGDIFVNDAFSVSHRKHASIVGIPKFLPTYFGPLFVEEVKNLSYAFNPEHPFLFILGGAKFSTKIPLIQKFLPLADHIFIGGALANDIFKAKGFEIGKSLVADEDFGIEKIIENKKIVYPSDVVVLDKENKKINKQLSEIEKDYYIGDVGEETLTNLKSLISKAKFVLWNGPTGNFEIGFKEMTEETAKALADSGATVITGGGDTVASLKELNILDKFTFVSTAGGAMLDFLANETLPGIEAGQS